MCLAVAVCGSLTLLHPPSLQSAIFNFQSILAVILLLICTCTYCRALFPQIMDRHKTGSVTHVHPPHLHDCCSSTLGHVLCVTVGGLCEAVLYGPSVQRVMSPLHHRHTWYVCTCVTGGVQAKTGLPPQVVLELCGIAVY